MKRRPIDIVFFHKMQSFELNKKNMTKIEFSLTM